MQTASIARGILSISRPATSTIFATFGGAALYLAGEDVQSTWLCTLLFLLLSLATFTINDLMDAERDRVNHPRRFLVLNPAARSVSVIYYALLTVAYCAISMQVPGRLQSWGYMAGLIVFINYSIIKIDFPLVKNAYIALACIGFCSFIALSSGVQVRPHVAAGAFIFVLAREILMDVPDIKGDLDSIAKRLGLRTSMFFITALSFAAATTLAIGSWRSNTMLALASYVFPFLLLVRMRHIQLNGSIDLFTRVTTGLPYLFCVYLLTSA